MVGILNESVANFCRSLAQNRLAGLVVVAAAITLSGRLESRIDRIADDMKQFYMIPGRH
jgi:hypothetical protein